MKKKQLGKGITTGLLLTGAIVVLFYLFFSDMGLNSVQIVIFAATILLISLLSKLHHWLRYPLLLILFCIGGGVLLLSFLPDFDQTPDEERFFATQNPVLHTYKNIETSEVTSESIISISNDSQKRAVSTDRTQSQEINFDGDLEIRYASKTENKDNFAILELINGSQVIVFPQSSFVIKNGVYVSSGQTVWTSESLQNRQDELLENFEEKKRLFFVEEAGGSYLENYTVNTFMEYYLSALFSIDAERFGQKLLNFQEYQKYFHIESDKNYNIGFAEKSVESAVKERGNSAWEQTKLKEWWDSL